MDSRDPRTFIRLQRLTGDVRTWWPLVLSLLLLLLAYWALMPPASSGDSRYAPLPALATRLVLIDVDGLRADFATDPTVMPALVARAATNVSGVALTTDYPVSLPAIKAWLVGSPFTALDTLWEFAGIDRNADSVFRQANQAGHRIAFAGPVGWVDSFGPWLDAAYVTESFARDDLVHARAREFVLDSSYDIVAVHYTTADMAAHQFGVREGTYANTLRRLDGYIDDLARAAGPGAAVLIVSDHGMTEAGSHFTADPDVVRTPFVLIGPGVRTGVVENIRQIDIAPTLSVLLGLDFPGQAQGRILAEALLLTAAQRAYAQITYADTRLNRLEHETPRQPDLHRELEVAEQSYAAGKYALAGRLAEGIQHASDFRLEERRQMRIVRVAWLCLAVVLVGSVMLLRSAASGGRTGRRYGEPAVRLASIAAVLTIPAVWQINRYFHGVDSEVIWPFRSDYLAAHWVFLAIAMPSLAILTAVAARTAARLPAESQTLWFVVLTGLSASIWQAYDLWHWILVLTVAAYGLTALIDPSHLRRAAAAAGLFAVTLAIRHAQTTGHATTPFAEAAAFVAGLVLLGLSSWAIPRLADLDPRSRRPDATTLALVGLGACAHAARLLHVGWAEWLIVPIFGVLLIPGSTPAGGRERTLVRVSLALIAVAPLLFPAVFALTIILVCLALAGGILRPLLQRASAPLAAAVQLLVVLFVHFALNGRLDLFGVELRRMFLLDPSFTSYGAFVRIIVLLALQVALPTLLAAVWMAFTMRDHRDTWTRAVIIVGWFFWIQVATALLNLQFSAGFFNIDVRIGLLVNWLALSVAYQVSSVAAGRLVFGTFTATEEVTAANRRLLDGGQAPAIHTSVLQLGHANASRRSPDERHITARSRLRARRAYAAVAHVQARDT